MLTSSENADRLGHMADNSDNADTFWYDKGAISMKPQTFTRNGMDVLKKKVTACIKTT